METRIHYQEKMDKVHEDLEKMGVLVEEAVKKSLTALADQDHDLAKEIIAHDKVIDDLKATIEDQCVKIIATEQPVAGDLRDLVTVIKIVANLERIGDHARHYAKAIDRIAPKYLERTMPQIREMADIGLDMLYDSLGAFKTYNEQLSKEIAARDDRIDDLHKKLYREIVAMIKEDPEAVEDGYTLLILNRFLERMGDHITNICEWTCFAKTGVHPDLN